jgi:hypothetical protein
MLPDWSGGEGEVNGLNSESRRRFGWHWASIPFALGNIQEKENDI